MLKNENNLFWFVPTPIDISRKLSKELSINLLIKRDDLFFQTGGGSKSRKILYILQKAYNEGYNAIVTAGSSQSNHVRATALFAAKLGWKSTMIIHDKKPNGSFEGNLKIVSLTGSEIQFVDKDEVKDAMDHAMLDFKQRGYKPLYIWGGGHCLEGSYAYFDAFRELKEQLGNLNPEYIVLASGTGTTQAGLEIGVRHFSPKCKVLGVSISRTEKKGKEAIIGSMHTLNDFLQNLIELPNDIFFDDRWIGDGYEATYPEMLETIHWAAKTEGLILDPTYTGKAFYALKKYTETGVIPKGAIVVFWHTGGLLNLLSSKEI
jgi:1-aminocyclopropane-1-carboxylate deaminase/D-cysteine desulfhydrase-like pyridoxal-dependent ACC family enzyme